MPVRDPVAARRAALLRPAPGHRLFLVTLGVGEEPIVRDDVAAASRLITLGRTARRRSAPAAASASIVPFDRIAVGREVGEILPSDAMIVLTRALGRRASPLEVGPRGTIAFLYEVPLAATVRALRLPDGRELAITHELIFPFADLALSRRLERAEALGNARFVEARARLFPAAGRLLDRGRRRPRDVRRRLVAATQTFGLGMSRRRPPSRSRRDRGVLSPSAARRCYHEVSPLADAAARCRCSRAAATGRSSSPA